MAVRATTQNRGCGNFFFLFKDYSVVRKKMAQDNKDVEGAPTLKVFKKIFGQPFV